MRSAVRCLLFALCLLPWPARSQQIATHRLTIAANQELRLSDSEVDDIVAGMAPILNVADFSWDVACAGVDFERRGTVILSPDIPLSVAFSSDIMRLKSRFPQANVFVVADLTCGSVQAAGCSRHGFDAQAVKLFPGYDSQIWSHERGHIVGLNHSTAGHEDEGAVPENAGKRLMFWRAGVGHNGLTQDECDHFKRVAVSSIVIAQAAPSPPTGNRLTPHHPADNVLTEKAGKIITTPWLHEPPVDDINKLDEADLTSVRRYLAFDGPPAPGWGNAAYVIALRGHADDASLINRTLLSRWQALPGDASREQVVASRQFLQAKLSAPSALGVLALRTRSDFAVSGLLNVIDLEGAKSAIGEAAAPSLARAAIRNAQISQIPRALAAVETAVTEARAVNEGRAATSRFPRLSNDDISELTRLGDAVRVRGLEAIVPPQ